jgi:hypothetical protein
MLIIRQEQMAAFERSLLDDFVARAARRVEADHPEPARALTPDGVRATVHEAIARASAAGIEDEDGVMLYLRAMLERGRDFDREPWAAFLKDPAVAPPFKLVELARALHGGER